MTQKTSIPRYYIRDQESNDMWCFDARSLGGKKQPATS